MALSASVHHRPSFQYGDLKPEITENFHVKRVYFNSQTTKQRDFNSYPNVFWVRESNGPKADTIQRKRKRENQDGGGQTGYTYN